MKRNLYFIVAFCIPFLLSSVAALGQFKISGRVVDEKKKPIKGANVYLDNTLDGGTSDSLGQFSFVTTEKGNQSIVASELTHITAGAPLVITGDISGIEIVLKTSKPKEMDVVTITAGAFEASNDKSKTVLKPLDIVTTAGAGADVVKAMQTLPGTQQTGPDNGLFVRGGDASEAAVIVDEMVVQNAFFSGAPGVATRSRFGAFQYQGVSFSSGGYSARYGQALSGVLELNTTDLADKSTVNLGANLAGAYASGVKRWKNSSLNAGGGYTNLAPFYGLIKSNFNFYKVPEGGNGNIRYVWKPNKNGILKVSLNATTNATGVAIPNPSATDTSGYNPLGGLEDTINFATKDRNYYSNISYKQLFKAKYQLYTAASFSKNNTNNVFGNLDMYQRDYRNQFRVEGKDYFTSRLNLMVGTDIQNFGKSRGTDTFFKQQYDEVLIGTYTELTWTPVNRLAIKPGIRFEHSTLLDADNVAPRLSMAYKTGTHSQMSVAGGMFYQEAADMYLLAGLKPEMQLATHYIANWQWSQDNRTLRLEGYYKNYDNLVLEQASSFDPNSYRYIGSGTKYTNGGTGYAQGIELFWRDKKSVKNMDYWISYSYIDTKRKFANYLSEATPPFIANHNLNLVGKYWINKLNTNISATYSYATGRPYYNPQNDNTIPSQFMSDRTPEYHKLALSFAYLHSFGKWFTVFYVSIDNVTNRKNVFGYRYSRNASGAIEKSQIVPALYRTIFLGVNMSLTAFSKDEL